MPKVFIIAGPNGSGKTTFANEFLPAQTKHPNFINADAIAKGLSPFGPERAAIPAGRLVLKKIEEYAGKGEDFAFETTLSGKTYLNILKRLKGKGYELHLFFLWVPDVSLSIARIKERVAKGGHNIPSTDVQRRFGRTLKNFVSLYEELMDSWMIFDNSGEKPELIAKGINGNLQIAQPDLFNKIMEQAGLRK